eukprot:CAMPEP_0194357730 /NCGR_PEP_ID=MMETSP0174-20130528/5167_1 /TAXON_ID=216777 /ORGANISM="Proboscia alata, Strain PI-D3" /LENGTH=760 /DNA_ID=CAMNT_0039127871 /DNA_START=51 /DNA_END=2333 /DNA_ORIENTATION=+
MLPTPPPPRSNRNKKNASTGRANKKYQNLKNSVNSSSLCIKEGVCCEQSMFKNNAMIQDPNKKCDEKNKRSLSTIPSTNIINDRKYFRNHNQEVDNCRLLVGMGSHKNSLNEFDRVVGHEDFGQIICLAAKVKAAHFISVLPSSQPWEKTSDLSFLTVGVPKKDHVDQTLLKMRLFNGPAALPKSKATIVPRGMFSQTDSLVDAAIEGLTGEFQRCLTFLGNNGPSTINKKREKNNATSDGPTESVAVKYSKRQTDILTNWMIEHRRHPFPDAREIKELSAATNLSYSQVVNWTTNVRKRNLKATVEGGKKPHHFLDFLFLADARERSSQNGALSSNNKTKIATLRSPKKKDRKVEKETTSSRKRRYKDSNNNVSSKSVEQAKLITTTNAYPPTTMSASLPNNNNINIGTSRTGLYPGQTHFNAFNTNAYGSTRMSQNEGSRLQISNAEVECRDPFGTVVRSNQSIRYNPEPYLHIPHYASPMVFFPPAPPPSMYIQSKEHPNPVKTSYSGGFVRSVSPFIEEGVDDIPSNGETFDKDTFFLEPLDHKCHDSEEQEKVSFSSLRDVTFQEDNNFFGGIRTPDVSSIDIDDDNSHNISYGFSKDDSCAIDDGNILDTFITTSVSSEFSVDGANEETADENTQLVQDLNLKENSTVLSKNKQVETQARNSKAAHPLNSHQVKISKDKLSKSEVKNVSLNEASSNSSFDTVQTSNCSKVEDNNGETSSNETNDLLLASDDFDWLNEFNGMQDILTEDDISFTL